MVNLTPIHAVPLQLALTSHFSRVVSWDMMYCFRTHFQGLCILTMAEKDSGGRMNDLFWCRELIASKYLTGVEYFSCIIFLTET